MSVENLEINGNQVQEGDKEANVDNAQAQQQDNAEQGKEIIALSVKPEAQKTSKALQLAQKPAILPGNRPIEPSHLKIVDRYSSVGGSRPISASTMHISSTLTISGNRPVSSSALAVSETYKVMGNRPVASNEIDEEPGVLMGYLD